ncbi:MAG: hypothetical protein MUO23_04860, partial [Anaerolineales bacterium]|nr:hypothetical protein [Anaerolineales bacterium]
WAAGRLIVAYTGSDGGTVLLLQALLGDPITLAAEVVDEPYPPAVLAVLADAAEQFDLPVASLSVIGLEETTWSDTCLDLPLPGETCLKGPLPGWRVQVRAGESEAWFRTDLAGEVVRLEEPAQVP